MKRILAAFLMMIASTSYGAWNDQDLLNTASFTPTNQTLKVIPLSYPGTVLRGVILSTEAALSIKIYDSSGTETNRIAQLGTGAVLSNTYVDFNVRLSSGLTYTTAGNTLGVTFVYLKVRP